MTGFISIFRHLVTKLHKSLAHILNIADDKKALRPIKDTDTNNSSFRIFSNYIKFSFMLNELEIHVHSHVPCMAHGTNICMYSLPCTHVEYT